MTLSKHPIDHLIHTTVRIECQDKNGDISSGSGFYFTFLANGKDGAPCIVSNKHVIEGAVEGTINVTFARSSGDVDLGNHVPIKFRNFESMWIKHPDPEVDLAIFPIAPLLNNAKRAGKELFFIQLNKAHIGDDSFYNSLSVMEDIIMIGYPNGLWDEHHNLPIIRKGITATSPSLPYNGKDEFLIDAACFPGSSGSPIFLANIGSFMDKEGNLNFTSRIALIGILYAGPIYQATGEIRSINIPTRKENIAITDVMLNLGQAIFSTKLLDFEPILEKMK